MTMRSVLVVAARRRAPLTAGWPQYLLGRGGGLLLSVGVLVVATFLIIPLLPGDPAIAILGQQATPASIADLRERLHLDDPLQVRFVDYLSGLIRLDLGDSFRFHIPVATIIATKLPYTLGLAGWAILLVIAVAVPVGMAVGVLTREGRRPAIALGFGAVAGLLASVPGYVLGTVLILVFAIGLHVLPPGSAVGPFSAVLPVLALSIGPTAAVARVVRQETQTVMLQDFIRTAQGKRLGAGRLYLRHALPNLLNSTLTLGGLILAGIVGGTVIVESVFNYPGIGSEIVQAIIYKDYPVVQGIVLAIGLLAIVLNLLIDIVLAITDPRILSGGLDG